jgi:hypothetical protein
MDRKRKNILKLSPGIELTKKYGLKKRYSSPYSSKKLSSLYKEFKRLHLDRKRSKKIRGKRITWIIKPYEIDIPKETDNI